MSGKNIYVVTHHDKWAVKKEAQKIATEYAKSEKSELIVKNKDGKIGTKNSYGNDPCPPKDKNK